MPKCPNCEKEISFKNLKIIQKGKGFFRQDSMYVCPHCDCVVGISRGKYTG